jgi:5-methylcytosine-specific restriction endonuclease McrA
MRANNFSRKTRREASDRADGCCEGCGARLKKGEGECDHILPAELGGEPVLSNAQWLCRMCHADKTADDIRRIRKADRMRDKASGAWKPPHNPMPGSKASGLRKRMSGQVERR